MEYPNYLQYFIYINLKKGGQDDNISYTFFIFLICIYTHIVKQITKHIYKYLMPFCTNYKLYLALVFKLGSRNWSFGEERETEPKRKNKTTFCFNVGRTAACSLIHRNQTECSFSNRPGSKYHSRCFYLSGRGSPEPTRWHQ